MSGISAETSLPQASLPPNTTAAEDETKRYEQSRPNLPATTTLLQDVASRHQQRVNLTWEFTQASIAVLVVISNILAVFLMPAGSSLLANAFFLVIGFYFGRTNHARPEAIAGIGAR